jgi:thiol-disulfide isomerase/thioredoxin
MRFNRVLPWYALLLIVLLCTALMNREGFTTSASSFESDVAGKKIFVLFYSKNCGHCTKLLPKWQKIESFHPSKMTSIECSSTDDKTKAICTKYGINSYPTMMVLDDGVAQNTYDGDRDEVSLNTFVKSL